MDNELKDDLIKSDLEVRYDEHVKKLLANKKTLAWILKYSAVEYKDCTINEIVGFIEGTPEISSVGVDNGFTAQSIKGNPNEENGEYKSSIGLLYGIAFTIKMSYKGTHKIEGFFEYVVPPLEGLWWQENTQGLDYARKEDMHFISMIRLPDFVTKEDFEWAVQEATKKKKQDFSKVEFFPYDEGLCVQCMHIGSYDAEPATVDLMHDYMKANGYELDITDTRYHHEIYLSDPRKCDVSRLKTVVRHPIRKTE